MDILNIIIPYLDLQSLGNLFNTCKYFNNLKHELNIHQQVTLEKIIISKIGLSSFKNIKITTLTIPDDIKPNELSICLHTIGDINLGLNLNALTIITNTFVGTKISIPGLTRLNIIADVIKSPSISIPSSVECLDLSTLIPPGNLKFAGVNEIKINTSSCYTFCQSKFSDNLKVLELSGSCIDGLKNLSGLGGLEELVIRYSTIEGDIKIPENLKVFRLFFDFVVSDDEIILKFNNGTEYLTIIETLQKFKDTNLDIFQVGTNNRELSIILQNFCQDYQPHILSLKEMWHSTDLDKLDEKLYQNLMNANHPGIASLYNQLFHYSFFDFESMIYGNIFFDYYFDDMLYRSAINNRVEYAEMILKNHLGSIEIPPSRLIDIPDHPLYLFLKYISDHRLDAMIEISKKYLDSKLSLYFFE